MEQRPLINLTIDNQPVSVAAGTTLWEAARIASIPIPVLCHSPNLDPVAVCRVCAVHVEGARVFPAACIRAAEEGMIVHTDSEQVQRSRRMVVELLLADHPRPCEKHRLWGNCELELLAEQMGLVEPRFPGRDGRWGLWGWGSCTEVHR
jgi:NADH dehydrogenase/NADH:ubiquinone oxidoreductase subunit G